MWIYAYSQGMKVLRIGTVIYYTKNVISFWEDQSRKPHKIIVSKIMVKLFCSYGDVFTLKSAHVWRIIACFFIPFILFIMFKVFRCFFRFYDQDFIEQLCSCFIWNVLWEFHEFFIKNFKLSDNLMFFLEKFTTKIFLRKQLFCYLVSWIEKSLLSWHKSPVHISYQMALWSFQF